MGQVVKSPSALEDLAQIVAYIAADKLTAAIHWLDDINALFELLADQPEIGQIINTNQLGSVRRHAFGKYLIYYRPTTTGVDILRVLHGARMQDDLV